MPFGVPELLFLANAGQIEEPIELPEAPEPVQIELAADLVDARQTLGLVYSAGLTGDGDMSSQIASLMPGAWLSSGNCSAGMVLQTAPAINDPLEGQVAIPLLEGGCEVFDSGETRIYLDAGRTILPVVPTDGPAPHNMTPIGFTDLGYGGTIDERIGVSVESGPVSVTAAILDGGEEFKIDGNPDLMGRVFLDVPGVDPLGVESAVQYSTAHNDLVAATGSASWNGDRLDAISSLVVTQSDDTEALQWAGVAQVDVLAVNRGHTELHPYFRVATTDFSGAQGADLQAGMSLVSRPNGVNLRLAGQADPSKLQDSAGILAALSVVK